MIPSPLPRSRVFKLFLPLRPWMPHTGRRDISSSSLVERALYRMGGGNASINISPPRRDEIQEDETYPHILVPPRQDEIQEDETYPHPVWLREHCTGWVGVMHLSILVPPPPPPPRWDEIILKLSNPIGLGMNRGFDLYSTLHF